MAKRTRGALLPPTGAGRPRRRDIYRILRSAVLDGVLVPGERLPSSRQAGSDYGVSRGLIEEVYGQLSLEGFLRRTVGSGTFVSEGATRLSTPARGRKRARRSPAPSRRGLALAASAACREPDMLCPFNAGVADAGEFPWRVWHRLQARASRELGRRAFDFADPRGLPELRAAIARYLAQFRGLRCRASQVIVFNSAQQALYALAALLLDRGDTAWMEDPGYPGAREALRLAGAEVVSVPVDEEGLRVEVGVRRAPRARLAYVTPAHQYPMGVALSLDRRVALLDWAAKTDAWVVEDDYDGEFRYAGQPLTTLHSLDPGARVLYIGTLSKAMFVSLRLAYAVVPEDLVEPLANIRTHLDGFSPALPQMTTSLFMDEGRFASHLRRMRGIYGSRRAELVEGLAPLAAEGWSWPDNPAGLHLLVRHPTARLVRGVVSASSLDLARLGPYRSLPARGDGLFLRFGGLDAATLRAGLGDLLTAARRAKG